MRNKKKLIALLVGMLAMLLFVGCGGNDEDYATFEWPDSELGKILPQPDLELYGEIEEDDEELNVIIAKVSSDDFDEYIELCEDEGFDLETLTIGDYYYNSNNISGYEITVEYDEKTKVLEIELDARNVYGEFTWPNSDIAKMLPVPKSNYGSISWESSNGFFIYVAETSEEDYNEYVNLCKEAGFTVDYQAGDDYFYADNELGYHLSLTYNDGNVMQIRMDAPDDDEIEETEDVEVEESEENEPEVVESEDTATVEETQDTVETEESSLGVADDEIRPEFKEALDSYEAFFDEYIAFMEKYEESDDIMSMLTDYSNYMTQYAETMDKLSAIADEEMTTAEAAYYLEVTTRINQKLLDYTSN